MRGSLIMTYLTKQRRRSALIGMLAGALVLFSCVATASAATKSVRPHSAHAFPAVSFTTLRSPLIPGVSQLPGPVAGPARPSPTMGILQVSPDEGVAGAPLTISGSHLPANANVELTWSTADATWLVQAKPDTVNYLGRSDTLFAVVLDTTTTSASGSFSVSLKVPQDWGGLHDIYAVVKGAEVAHGGFITLRTVTVTPTSGPIGTPITVTYSGLGATFYTGGASLLWDNHYVGEMMANWTRRCGAGDDPCCRARGPAHDPDRQRHQLLVPQRAAVADSLHQRCNGHLHGDKGRRAAACLY